MNNQEIEFLQKQLTYIESMGKDVDNGNYFDLFPVDWHANADIKLKGEILDEAISRHCSINDTSLYANTMQEGVIDLASKIKARANTKN